MSEGKLRGYQTIPTSDKCNGRVNSFKIGDRDAFHCTNGNHLRNSPMNVDKTQGVNVQMSQMEHGRSHRCLQRETVQTRFNNASVYSKFAFHWIYNVVLLVAVCSVTSGQQQESRLNMRNTDTFGHTTPIQPIIFDGTNQREILTTTQQTNGEHVPHIILEYIHFGKAIVADLRLNQHLLTEQHFLQSQNVDGSKNVRRFNRSDSDLCHYNGRIRNIPSSMVALSTCNGINGIVNDGNNSYIILPTGIRAIDEPHHLISQSQTKESNSIEDDWIDADPVEISKKKIKRSVSNAAVLEPYNANKQTSFVELVIVVDHEVYEKMDQNLDKVHTYCKNVANIINSLYVPLNIFIALVGVVVWTEQNEIELSADGDKTLKNFLNYRRKVLSKDHPNDNAQLLTDVQFDGGVVGKALKGPICTYEFSGGVSTYHSSIDNVVATTIAHEMGHNFGMEHDTPDCKCDDERCIMSASSSSIAPTRWSDCSVHQLNLAIHQGMNHCLRNIPKYLFSPPTCGNGFVEAGEECDCGLPNFCKNTCCDPMTCKLHSNATCATGKCCDLATCQPHEAGFECRSSAGECDLPEYCDGGSEFCPMDYFKRDTEECEGGKAYCYKGSCKSRDDQCKLLWGPTGKSSEQCYEKNRDGNRGGNCGYNRSANVYTQCEPVDIFCGMVQCRHLNERLEFGLESVAVLSHNFITHGGNVIPCRTAIVDLGLDSVDPGLAPDGSKCEDGKMCLNQKCVPLDTLRKNGTVKDCQIDCNGHGVCDNIGHCHCDKGYAPPNCDGFGPGGSVHSGPATNPDDGHGFARVLYVFFLGVVPFISLSLFLLYYWRQNKPWFISQTSANDLKISVRHYPDRPAPPPPSAPLTQLSPSSTDDMNATLLKTNDTGDETIKRELFGNFKGFSLKPLPMSKPNIVGASNVAYVHPVAKAEISNEQAMPSRAAPMPPSSFSPKKAPVKTSPVSAVKSALKSSSSSFRYQNVNSSEKSSPETPIEVKLFATKSDAKERPKISHPILENSTCSVKELVATGNAAKTHTLPRATAPIATQPSSNKVPTETSTFKKPEISAPAKRTSFGRSQSMRNPAPEKNAAKKSALASGSMRQPGGVKRVLTERPKNPPPPRPANLPAATSSLRNIYANVSGENSVDNSTDNIYCVIEDVQDSNELLSEIVNEIENRNLNSIYSTSRNQRKPAENGSDQTTYENVGQIPLKNDQKPETDGSLYMNTAEQPLIEQKSVIKNSINSPKSNVASIAKKISANSLAGNAKPAIATKPSVSNLVEAKNAASNKESSQKDSKKPNDTKFKSGASRANGKATLNPTSSVRALHKRFENRNA